jgi:DNA-binding PadR family transcriptional regulator
LGIDSQHTNAVRKAVLAVLYQNKADDLSYERLHIKVLRHMLPKIPEEHVIKSVLDKLVNEGYVSFEDDIAGHTIVKLSSKGVDVSERELKQFKCTVDKLAMKLSNAQR